jgi:predicted acylesterase/phospholipase RssA
MFWRPHPNALDQNHSLAIALQGGGAYGAYTWGVMDRLLAE